MAATLTIHRIGQAQVLLMQSRTKHRKQLLLIGFVLFLSGWLVYEIRTTAWTATYLWWYFTAVVLVALPVTSVMVPVAVYCLWQSVTALLGLRDILVDCGERLVSRAGWWSASFDDVCAVDVRTCSTTGYSGELGLVLSDGKTITLDRSFDYPALAAAAGSLADLLALPVTHSQTEPSPLARTARLLSLRPLVHSCIPAVAAAARAARDLAHQTSKTLSCIMAVISTTVAASARILRLLLLWAVCAAVLKRLAKELGKLGRQLGRGLSALRAVSVVMVITLLNGVRDLMRGMHRAIWAGGVAFTAALAGAAADLRLNALWSFSAAAVVAWARAIRGLTIRTSETLKSAGVSIDIGLRRSARVLIHHLIQMAAATGRVILGTAAAGVSVARLLQRYLLKAYSPARMMMIAGVAAVTEAVRGPMSHIHRAFYAMRVMIVAAAQKGSDSIKIVSLLTRRAISSTGVAIRTALAGVAGVLRLTELRTWCLVAVVGLRQAVYGQGSYIVNRLMAAMAPITTMGRESAKVLGRVAYGAAFVAIVAIWVVLTGLSAAVKATPVLGAAGIRMLGVVFNVAILFAAFAALVVEALIHYIGRVAVGYWVRLIAPAAVTAKALRLVWLKLFPVAQPDGAHVYPAGSRGEYLAKGLLGVICGLLLLWAAEAYLRQPLARWGAVTIFLGCCFASWHLLRRPYQVRVYPTGEIVVRRVLGSLRLDRHHIEAIDKTDCRMGTAKGTRELCIHHRVGTVRVKTAHPLDQLLAELTILNPAAAIIHVYRTGVRSAVLAKSLFGLMVGAGALGLAAMLCWNSIQSGPDQSPVDRVLAWGALLGASGLFAGCGYLSWRLVRRVPCEVRIYPDGAALFQCVGRALRLHIRLVDAIEPLPGGLHIYHSRGIVSVPNFDLVGELAAELTALKPATVALDVHDNGLRGSLIHRSLLELAIGAVLFGIGVSLLRQPLTVYRDTREIGIFLVPGAGLLGIGALLVWFWIDCWRILTQLPYQIRVYPTGTVVCRRVVGSAFLYTRLIQTIETRAANRKNLHIRELRIRHTRGTIPLQHFEPLDELLGELCALNPAVSIMSLR